MSKFLPKENIVFKTKLSKEQAIQKLAEKIGIERPYGFSSPHYSYTKPYIGKINGYSFEIEKAIGYRNSFLPIIKGEVYTDFEGTKIKVNMKLHEIVKAFLLIWFGGVIFFCFVTMFLLFSGKSDTLFFIPFVMLFFVIALTYFGFKSESSTNKKDLLKIFEAEIEKQ